MSTPKPFFNDSDYADVAAHIVLLSELLTGKRIDENTISPTISRHTSLNFGNWNALSIVLSTMTPVEFDKPEIKAVNNPMVAVTGTVEPDGIQALIFARSATQGTKVQPVVASPDDVKHILRPGFK